VRIDAFKLAHWLNARKYTVAHAAVVSGIDEYRWQTLLQPDGDDIEPALAVEIAAILRVDPSQIAASATTGGSIVWQSAEAMYATKRLVRRDGIDFYNYYTLAGPEGAVAPVVLDILCPADRAPALNEGHLEPAITVNLGPGDIHGRWGVELNDLNWRVLAANTGEDRWITGESYVEPSFCPHSYSLVSTVPARIVSYTGASNLAPLMEEVNGWPKERFVHLTEACADGPAPSNLLDLLLVRRMHDRSSAAALVGVSTDTLMEALSPPTSQPGLTLLRRLSAELGFDYRLLLPPQHRYDEAGKSCRDVPAARSTIREFNRYRVASMACAPHLPDLVGTFMDIAAIPGGGDHLRDCAETHYFVIAGEPTLRWSDHSDEHDVTLSPDCSAWIPPFVDHWWTGNGWVLKFGSGPLIGYQAWLELTNTFAAAATLCRGHRDLSGWGYDG
jgi:hypothetical protein